MEEKALVKNAASSKQVNNAQRKERFENNRMDDDLNFVLSTKQGRRFIWRLLSECKVFGSVWHPSAAIHYNSGKQDLGHWVMAESTRVSPDFFIEMMKENNNGGENV